MIRVVDYSVGNIEAFLVTFKRLGILASRASSPKHLSDASKIILPGVGAFDHSMEKLNQSGIRDALEYMVLDQKVPVLGICVGMQMLASKSEEGVLQGLNWIPGKVRRLHDFTGSSVKLPLPHMGWNDVKSGSTSQLLRGLEPNPEFYFLHSYYFDCDEEQNVIGVTNYGFDFSCIVSRNHIHGVQFHPEKSHSCGAKLLKNFSEF
jgi:glutamine amidotransferase